MVRIWALSILTRDCALIVGQTKRPVYTRLVTR